MFYFLIDRWMWKCNHGHDSWWESEYNVVIYETLIKVVLKNRPMWFEAIFTCRNANITIQYEVLKNRPMWFEAIFTCRNANITIQYDHKERVLSFFYGKTYYFGIYLFKRNSSSNYMFGKHVFLDVQMILSY